MAVTNFTQAQSAEVGQFQFRSVADIIDLGHGDKRFRLQFC